MLENTWIPENAEILTTLGWKTIKAIMKIERLTAFTDEAGFKDDPILEYNRRYFDGVLPYFNKKPFGKVNFYKDSYWTPFGEQEKPPLKLGNYTGFLYNVKTLLGTYFIKINNKYFLCQNQTVGLL